MIYPSAISLAATGRSPSEPIEHLNQPTPAPQRGKQWPPVEGVGAFAGLHLDELGGELEPLGLGESDVAQLPVGSPTTEWRTKTTK